MTKKRWLAAGILATAIIAGLLLPIKAQASPLARMVFGGTFVLGEGDVLDEELTIFGGNAVLEKDSEVRGDIQIFGGRLEVYGTVDGNVVAAGGVLKLGEEAVIEGDVTVAGAVLERDSGAVVEGEVITETEIPFKMTRFDGMWTPFHWWFDSLWNVVTYVGMAFALAALAVLVMMFFDKPTERTTRVLVQQPTTTTGLGCLTLVVAPFALILMILTICLIPFALVTILVLGVVITYGWIALGLEVGRRLSSQVHQDWAEPFAAGIGTFLLVIVGGLLNIIPLIGWVYTALISAAGIGAVLITKFGTEEYMPGQSISFLPRTVEPDKTIENDDDGKEEKEPNP